MSHGPPQVAQVYIYIPVVVHVCGGSRGGGYRDAEMGGARGWERGVIYIGCTHKG